MQPNSGYRQDGNSLDYEKTPGPGIQSGQGYKYCTFVQFYDTFTDFEDGNEMGDVTIDTVYKQWTIDTNRVSFIKNFLGLKKDYYQQNTPHTDNLEGWWNAFGAQLYYSTLEKEKED